MQRFYNGHQGASIRELDRERAIDREEGIHDQASLDQAHSRRRSPPWRCRRRPRAAPAEQILGIHRRARSESSASAPTVTSSGSDFSWADAALGAGVALAAVTIGVGGALMLRSVRAERGEIRLTS